MPPRVLDEQSFLAREQVIIDAALIVIEREGIENLTIDKVVDLVPFSKGTVYKHFSGKEDVILAINNQAIVILCDLFERVAKFDACPRERMLLLNFAYLIYSILHPVLFTVDLCARSPSVIEKCGQDRIDKQDAMQTHLMFTIGSIIMEGIEQGYLVLPESIDVQQICFSNWSMGYGIISLLSKHVETCEGRAGLSVERELFNNNNLLLDGLGWLPLSKDRDYKSAMFKDFDLVFSEELKALKALGRDLRF